MSSLQYRAARNLTIIGGLLVLGVIFLVASWWFGAPPYNSFSSVNSFLLAVLINSVVSIGCFLIAPAVRAGRAWGYVIGVVAGLLALTALPLGLGNVMGATVLFFVVRAWLDKDTRSPYVDDEAIAAAQRETAPVVVTGVSPMQVLGATAIGFLVGAGVVVLVGFQLLGGERLLAASRTPLPSRDEEAGARLYAIAAESKRELEQLHAMSSGDVARATAQVEAALDDHWRALGNYEDVVAPSKRSEFVATVISDLRRYHETHPQHPR